MRSLQKEVYVLSAKRTAFGAFGGSLKKLSATDLGVIASESALELSGSTETILGTSSLEMSFRLQPMPFI